jgi:hypothetical protein
MQFTTLYWCPYRWSVSFHELNSVVLVRKRTIPTKRPQPADEVSAKWSSYFYNSQDSWEDLRFTRRLIMNFTNLNVSYSLRQVLNLIWIISLTNNKEQKCAFLPCHVCISILPAVGRASRNSSRMTIRTLIQTDIGGCRIKLTALYMKTYMPFCEQPERVEVNSR